MIVEFSGGKDSLVALHLVKDKEDVKVFFADTGSIYPHMVKFVHETCAKWNLPLTVVSPPVPVEKYTAIAGMPSDIVPDNRSPEMKYSIGKDDEQKIQSIVQCCGNMLWLPLQNAVLASGDKTVVRGIKRSDKHNTVPPGHTDPNGITYELPIYDWTDEDVFDYLKEQGVTPAKHYEEVNTSMDCWLCTAHLTETEAKGRLEWTRRHHRKTLWPKLADRLRQVRRAVDEERLIVDRAMDVIPKYKGTSDCLKYERKIKKLEKQYG